LAVLLLGGEAGSAEAQGAARPAAPDSTVGPSTPVPSFQPAPPDTGGPVFHVVPDTLTEKSDAEAERVLEEAARRRRQKAQEQQKHKAFSEPRYVMLRSALVPGWGQLYNGAWLKAIGVAAGEIAFFVGIYNDGKELDRLKPLSDAACAGGDELECYQLTTEYNAALDSQTRRAWLLGGLVAYALADAYVDAHFKNFNVQFDAPRATSGGKKSYGARLRLGWSF